MIMDYKLIEKTLHTNELVFVEKIKETSNSLVIKVKNRSGGFQAVKILRNSKFKKEELLFLQNKNIDRIIKLQDNFNDEYRHYLVFNYYSNDLNTGAKKNPSRDTMKRWAFQLVSAFTKLEEEKLIHGDIKPENAVLDNSFIENSNVYVIDFGNHTSIDSPIITEVTLDYSAPEVIKESKFSLKSDIWSFGQLILYIFTLQKFMSKDTEEENLSQLHAICHEDFQLYNFLKKCFLDHEKRPTFQQLSKDPFFATLNIEINRVSQKISNLNRKAVRAFLLLNHKKLIGLRKIWVTFLHYPVINCIKFYFKKKFENIKNRFLDEIQPVQMLEIETKISQYSSLVEDFSYINPLEHLIKLYKECMPLNQLDKEFRKLLKKINKYIINP